MPQKIIVTIRMEKALLEALKKEAQDDGRSLADYVRRVLVSRQKTKRSK